MKNALGSLVLLGVAALGVILLLPVLGAIFLIIATVAALVVAAFLAAPLLARLPWFRDRIVVHRHGRGRSIRFGQGGFPPQQKPPTDVIDVEGRQVDDPTDDVKRLP